MKFVGGMYYYKYNGMSFFFVLNEFVIEFFFVYLYFIYDFVNIYFYEIYFC